MPSQPVLLYQGGQVKSYSGKKRDLELSVELSGFAVIIIIIKVVIKPHSREPAWPSGKASGW